MAEGQWDRRLRPSTKRKRSDTSYQTSEARNRKRKSKKGVPSLSVCDNQVNLISEDLANLPMSSSREKEPRGPITERRRRTTNFSVENVKSRRVLHTKQR